jgi:hypothetical protein
MFSEDSIYDFHHSGKVIHGGLRIKKRRILWEFKTVFQKSDSPLIAISGCRNHQPTVSVYSNQDVQNSADALVGAHCQILYYLLP